MRVLGIETSSSRGSVALWDGVQVVAHASHEEANRHGERILPLVEQVLEQAGWSRDSLTRVGVGVGPGSFTGLRVGIALATGISMGLGVPVLGVGSLRALAAAVPTEEPRVRLVVRDARREEFFIAAYDAASRELWAPEAVPQEGVLAALRERLGERVDPASAVVVGTPLEGFTLAVPVLEPDAGAVARVAGTLLPEENPAAPQYVRGPNAVRPRLPESPLSLPRV